MKNIKYLNIDSSYYFTKEQVKNFSYLLCEISYEYDSHYENKINKFGHICGVINRKFKHKIGKRPQS